MERMSKNPWSCATSAMKDAGELKGQLERGQQRQIEPGVTHHTGDPPGVEVEHQQLIFARRQGQRSTARVKRLPQPTFPVQKLRILKKGAGKRRLHLANGEHATVADGQEERGVAHDTVKNEPVNAGATGRFKELARRAMLRAPTAPHPGARDGP